MELAIKERLVENAAGFDIAYSSEQLAITDTITVEKLTKDWFLINNDGNYNEDTLIQKVQEFAKSLEERKAENWEVWKWKAERITDLKTKPENTVEYYVVKNKYSIVNPLLKAKQTLTRYFLISPDNKILLDSDNEKFDVDEESTALTFSYELALLKKKLKL